MQCRWADKWICYVFQLRFNLFVICSTCTYYVINKRTKLFIGTGYDIMCSIYRIVFLLQTGHRPPIVP